MKLLKSTKKQLVNIIFLVVGWKLFLLFVLVLALNLLPLNSKNFLGGGYENYIENPYSFSWANFDGEHYLSIAQKGYSDLNHSFFPLYPLLIKLVSFGNNNLQDLVISGLFISSISLILAILMLYKLIRIDFSEKISKTAIILLLIFPTAFYFNAVYTESLFLLLAVSTFYFGKKGNWYLASLFGILACTTRITGVILLPALLIEWYLQKSSAKNLIPIFLIPLGLVFYMFYLLQTTGNPLAFYNELSNFGEQRQGQFVLFPQVFYRYFKILLTPDLSLATIWVTVIELSAALLTLLLIFYGLLKKINLSYLVFSFLTFLMPTFTGSFSSLPRYFIVVFPLFIILSIIIENQSRLIKYLVFSLFAFLFIIESALFLRGYWVA